MFFHIMTSANNPVISGKLVLMCPHTTCSERHKTLCFCVYMHQVEIADKELFDEWAIKHLKHNKAIGSGGIQPESDYDYIEFSLGNFRDDYDFLITDSRH